MRYNSDLIVQGLENDARRAEESIRKAVEHLNSAILELDDNSDVINFTSQISLDLRMIAALLEGQLK